MGLLDDRVCVVTGGGRGIGAAICRTLAEAGAHVVVGYGHNEEAARETMAAIAQAGGQASAQPLDVTDHNAANQAAETVFDRHGRLDAWVNNAGVTRDNLLLAMDEADWRVVLDTNLDGVMRGTRAAAKYMMLQKRGSIVNLSSIAARHPNRGQSNYAASKGAIDAFTRALAVELAPKKVRVNAVAPGFILTDMSARVLAAAGDEIKGEIPLGRFGEPRDVAAVVLFLVSDLARYVTGEIVTVDGGLSL